MKRILFACGVVLGWGLAAGAATPAVLTTLRSIHELTYAEASKMPPVAFEATVTYRRAGETTLFVQDGDAAIYVFARAELRMEAGDRVMVRGKAQASFRPIVIAESVTVLRHGSLPKAVPASFDELARAERDCMRVAVRGRVLSASQVLSAGELTAHLELLVDGGNIEVYVNRIGGKDLKGLLDAEVEIAGVASARFDGKMQNIGVDLAVASFGDVRILKPAQTDPWTLPATPMDEIFAGYHVRNLSKRVRVHGTITYYQAGSSLVLQSGAKSLRVMTADEEPLKVGYEADVTGLPVVHDGFLTLEDGEVKQSGVYAPVAPQAATWQQLTGSKHIFDLVTIEGQVVTEVREGSQDEYVLLADGKKFSAIYHYPEIGGLEPARMNEIAAGSKVRVVGICVVENSNPFEREVPFDILLREPGDIQAISGPTVVNVRNLLLALGLLVVVLAGAGARSWAVERKMRRQTAAAANLERRRSRILEDINGARPLAEILEEILEMTSYTLGGAACWCEVTDGARLGQYPAEPERMRVVREEIPGRAGEALGAIGAAFATDSAPSEAEAKALQTGAGLATLAMETRKLYSDLRRRSEFDLLTDVNNRFSLESRLDAQIAEARENASIFGLVYIDLDRFKEINDMYGHNVGDLYLQEVAQRMKRQLRGSDLLARLGGDEFAVLVPAARNRAEVEEIARRLERSFDEPFYVQGSALRGSASVGNAIYPEDGITRDSLLSTADAAMYVAKHARG